ncbi:MAG: hypothetical protein ACRD39_05200, partial [Nitrososphaeraceae archaeon]
SPLGAFLQSALGVRKGAPGRMKLIGNANDNLALISTVANDAIHLLAGDGTLSFTTLQVSAELDIVWQTKHVFPDNDWGIYILCDVTASHRFVLASKLEGAGDDYYLFIYSLADGSTLSVGLLDGIFFTFGPEALIKAGADSVILSGTLNQKISNLGPQVAYYGEISSAASMSNEFIIGKGAETTVNAGAFCDGSNAYVTVRNSLSFQTTIKTHFSGTIAWQKRVGTSSPLVIAANDASGRAYFTTSGATVGGQRIIALSSVDGSFMWGKEIVRVKQVSTITIETFDAATTYQVTIHLSSTGTGAHHR